jgi:hypothetical protein
MEIKHTKVDVRVIFMYGIDTVRETGLYSDDNLKEIDTVFHYTYCIYWPF